MECANYHHKKAALLLGLELNKPENYEPGKEEPLLVALSLMNHEDVSLSPLVATGSFHFRLSQACGILSLKKVNRC